jgi:hypothetical protein
MGKAEEYHGRLFVPCARWNLGQVGQESNLHPAVLEVAALHSVRFCFVPLFGGFRTFSHLVFHALPFRSRALLPVLLPQAHGNQDVPPE